MKRLFVCLPLFCTTTLAQTKSVAGMPKDLEGGGRACYGHFTHTEARLSWKSSFMQCRSPFEVLQHDGVRWVLKVNRSKACAYEAIVVKGVIPTDVNKGMWNVVGYDRMSDIGKLGADTLGCGMLPNPPKEKTIAPAIK